MITGFYSIFVHNKTMGTNNRGEAPTNNIVWVMHMKSTSEPIVVITSRIPTGKYFPERAGLHERLGNSIYNHHGCTTGRYRKRGQL